MIQLNAIDKIYGTKTNPVHCLKSVNLTLSNKEFAVISGPSGSGKTTLLNIIGMLDVPSHGSYLLDGVDVSRISSKKRADIRLREIGFIFQAYNLMPVLTVRENTEMVLELQGMAKAKRHDISSEILDVLGLLEMADRYPSQLSGGQQQRVAVARAVASSPKLIIADEPTANLDSKTASSLLDYMLKLHHNRGVSFVFSSHDPLVIQRAHRHINLKDGAIVGDELGVVDGVKNAKVAG